ncbi:hypothetical protein F2Q70_00018135 [Brassica cretica]|uniref:Uncharacterized protein n=1 Tax=Brassica cretica TaxID=69181 RepID=A0A8S9KQ16_BRACR|nr:hypothetical protein F2Q70_00018135 [Brassica cretica]KAF2597420.1 hypothetical protein F2Q68_00011193 [Brassica cretica]
MLGRSLNRICPVLECSIKCSGSELPAGDVGDVSAYEPHVFFVLLGATRGYVLSAKRQWFTLRVFGCLDF